MATWWKLADDLLRREDAATMVEYTLLMILVAASCFAVISSFGSALAGLFQRAVNAFSH